MRKVSSADPASVDPAAARQDRPDRDFVASLGKGLAVLTCFDRAHPKLGVSEVARRVGVSPAAARRSLLTLHRLGFLARDEKRFWLLPKVLLMANAYLASRPAPNLVQPLLDSLAERTRESASIAQLMADQSIIIARSTARRSLTVGLRIGSTLPAHCSATGRVLLAALPAALAAARIRAMPREALTQRTVTSVDGVVAAVERCRRDGHAMCDSELEVGVRSMAVPVHNRGGETIAALSIAVRADRMTAAQLRSGFLPTLLRARRGCASNCSRIGRGRPEAWSARPGRQRQTTPGNARCSLPPS